MHVELEGQFTGVSFLLLPRGPWELNSAWWQVPLPMESSHRPYFFFPFSAEIKPGAFL